MIRRLQITLLMLFVSVWAMASETSVKNADGVEIWYDFDSSAKRASVTYKGGAQYTYLDEYIGNVVIPSKVTYEGKEYSVTSIGNDAFSYCSSLTSITIPESVTSIGKYAFYNCSGLTSITIPESVTSLGEWAFTVCSSLTSITIPKSVTEIGEHAFYSCDALTSITLSEGVTEIGSSAFSRCSSLTSITIPESVTSIGDDAFFNCSGLTSITSLNATPPSTDFYTFKGVDKSIPVYVPKQSVEAYKSAEYWKDFTNIQGIDDTPISDVVADSVSIRLIGNSLIVEGAESYVVYALSGQCLGMVESLERGVYIVVVDGVSKRIVVK